MRSATRAHATFATRSANTRAAQQNPFAPGYCVAEWLPQMTTLWTIAGDTCNRFASWPWIWKADAGMTSKRCDVESRHRERQPALCKPCVVHCQNITMAVARFWSSRVSAVKFSRGMSGALVIQMSALVFAGLPTTRTLTLRDATRFNDAPCWAKILRGQPLRHSISAALPFPGAARATCSYITRAPCPDGQHLRVDRTR